MKVLWASVAVLMLLLGLYIGVTLDERLRQAQLNTPDHVPAFVVGDCIQPNAKNLEPWEARTLANAQIEEVGHHAYRVRFLGQTVRAMTTIDFDSEGDFRLVACPCEAETTKPLEPEEF